MISSHEIPAIEILTRISGKVATFAEAQTICKAMQGHLVEMENDAEFDYVKSLSTGRQGLMIPMIPFYSLTYF